jgi:hypothetical protein
VATPELADRGFSTFCVFSLFRLTAAPSEWLSRGLMAFFFGVPGRRFALCGPLLRLQGNRQGRNDFSENP